MPSLIQPLFDGPIDIVGDVHGEIDALRSLLAHLGYTDNGKHSQGRRLVFLGDLIDRGPDSPAVVDLVGTLMDAGRAQCVLGNHDLNILLDHRKHENKWFYGEEFFDEQGQIAPQKLADTAIRQRVRDFFATLPLALERDDARVVHACWDDQMIGVAKEASDTARLYEDYRCQIESEVAKRALDEIDVGLQHQNHNPVKLLTSGPEERSETPFKRSGQLRFEKRVFWWNNYRHDVFCAFGHYAFPDGAPRGNASAFCVDFGIGKRWTERRAGKTAGFVFRLGAVRLPEKTILFVDGEVREEMVVSFSAAEHPQPRGPIR